MELLPQPPGVSLSRNVTPVPPTRFRPGREPPAAARRHRADQKGVLVGVFPRRVHYEEVGLFQYHHAG